MPQLSVRVKFSGIFQYRPRCVQYSLGFQPTASKHYYYIQQHPITLPTAFHYGLINFLPFKHARAERFLKFMNGIEQLPTIFSCELLFVGIFAPFQKGNTRNTYTTSFSNEMLEIT